MTRVLAVLDRRRDKQGRAGRHRSPFPSITANTGRRERGSVTGWGGLAHTVNSLSSSPVPYRQANPIVIRISRAGWGS